MSYYFYILFKKLLTVICIYYMNEPRLVAELYKAIKMNYPQRDSLPLNTKNQPPDLDTNYSHLSRIVAEKVNVLNNFNDASPESESNVLSVDTYRAQARLAQDLEQAFKGQEMRDNSSNQFPSFSFYKFFPERQFDYLRCYSALRIYVSLISKHYTVFYDETIWVFGHPSTRVKKRTIENPGTVQVYMSCLSSKNEFVDPGDLYIKQIKKLVKASFPKHKFVPVRLLFDYAYSDAIPYRDISNRHDYPLFAYLFDFESPAHVVVRGEY